MIPIRPGLRAGVLLFIASLQLSSWAQVKSEQLPRVLVLATGGTIAHVADDSYITGNQLIKDIPELGRYARLEVEEIDRIPSSAISPQLWLKLAKRANSAFAKDSELAGIVVPHGSNTVEETAYFLNLAVKDPRPVVLTAAQRRHGTLSSDGQHNLLDAVRVAADKASRGRGALLAVNQEINGARDVTKTITTRLETYETRDLGNLGYVQADRVAYYRTVEQRHTTRSEFDVSAVQELPRVDIVYAAAGIDGEIVKGLLESGKPKGIVVAAFPTGDVFPAMEEALDKAAAQGVFVVITNRGGIGRVPDGAYKDRANWISGDNLTPQKARVLLMVALTKTQNLEQLRRIFREY